jgi:hypothetical protein
MPCRQIIATLLSYDPDCEPEAVGWRVLLFSPHCPVMGTCVCCRCRSRCHSHSHCHCHCHYHCPCHCRCCCHSRCRCCRCRCLPLLLLSLLLSLLLLLLLSLSLSLLLADSLSLSRLLAAEHCGCIGCPVRLGHPFPGPHCGREDGPGPCRGLDCESHHLPAAAVLPQSPLCWHPGSSGETIGAVTGGGGTRGEWSLAPLLAVTFVLHSPASPAHP